MIKKTLHTVDDYIVQDVYSAFSDVVVDKFYFGGGMSTQLYLPEFLRRFSSDVDTNGIPKLSFGEFKGEFGAGLEKLVEKGYSWSSKKRRNTYDLIIEDSQSTVLLQYPNKKTSSLDFMTSVCDRESQNTQHVSYNGLNLNVMAMEDIVTRKFLRMYSFMNTYQLNMPKTQNFFNLRKKINKLKVEVNSNSDLTPEEVALDVAKIRLMADYFDVVALTVYKGFNSSYLKEAVESFNDLKDKFGLIQDYLLSFNPNALQSCSCK
ncbi:hypothetical protein JXM83_07415 [Candidatus Woesearchaeota archaeon]|nr:hypothetical protein [Candidatus Woesearchaeota archaeon]